ncbi:MAG: alpha/beta hydrolase [Ruminococcaceae bacterium]|nr:alpha/beta hydrolase [Oscillospiraceae bacterium]
MSKNKNKIITSILLGTTALGVLGIVYKKTAHSLVKMALDREHPKFFEKGRDKVRGSKELCKIIQTMTKASNELESTNCEQIEIKAHDGTRLIGHWRSCESPKRIIIAMHGWRSSWSHDFGIIAPFWHDNDCCVLFAEQRGQGLSGGNYMGFGMLERYDCFEWIKWVNEKTGGQLPIYLGGVSMGASTILMTAGFDLPSNVCGIIADCGFTSPHAIWKHVLQSNLHIPYGLYSAVANDMCKKKIQMGSNDYSCIEALKNNKIPVLFVHGSDDHFVPIKMTYENYRACSAPKHLFIVPGAEHGMSYLVDKAGYEKRVIDFWNEYDIKTPCN